MAQIKQVGIGRKSTGTIDGITYYVLNGKTFARSTPTMPASVYNTTEARIRQAIFKMVQMHMKHHLRTIRQTITASNGTPCNRYYSLNKKGLNAALQTLAEQYWHRYNYHRCGGCYQRLCYCTSHFYPYSKPERLSGSVSHRSLARHYHPQCAGWRQYRHHRRE